MIHKFSGLQLLHSYLKALLISWNLLERVRFDLFVRFYHSLLAISPGFHGATEKRGSSQYVTKYSCDLKVLLTKSGTVKMKAIHY
jgi:hypothetical protein